MESEFNPEQNEPVKVTLEEQLHEVANNFGFLENADLKHIRDKLAAIEESEERLATIAEWQVQARSHVEQTTDPSDPKPQVGLLIASAEMLIQAGLIEDAVNELDDAIAYAEGIEEFELADQLVVMKESLLG